MAADDVATAVERAAVGAPANGIVEVGGPEQFEFDMLIRRFLGASNDARVVLSDPSARYFGAVLGDRTLVPGDAASLGEIKFEDWIRQSAAASAVPA
jgi:uncharacterized protein YbjT (DUF2867 family)